MAALALLALLPACGDISGTMSSVPLVTIEEPANDTFVRNGESVTFKGSAEDPEDGSLTGDALTWTSDVEGTLGTGVEVTVAELSAGSHTITLSAVDSDGVTGTASINLLVEDTPG